MPLLPFQAEDVEKLHTKRSRLIGNDPGTGKTYEGIAIDQANRAGNGHPKVVVPERCKTLVIAPKNVLGVWDDHLMELTEDDVYLYSYHSRHKFFAAVTDPWTKGYFIINWESLRIDDAKVMRDIQFFNIIADECHYAKNEKAQVTRALWKLRTTYKTAMSGTPADNSPPDLWAINHWLWPTYYTSKNRFVRAYCTSEPVMKRNDQGELEDSGFKKITGVNEDTIPELHAEMAPWFVRRRKQDVLKDLPDKYYSVIKVDLTPKQRKAYNDMKKLMIAWVDEHLDELEAGQPLIAGQAITQLIRLQQFSDGYMVPLLDEDGNQVIKIVHKGHRSVISTSIISAANGCTARCREVPQWKMTDPSAKLDALMEFITNRNEQIVIWSWSKATIKLLMKRLDAAASNPKLDASRYTYGEITGDVSSELRRKYVEDFQAGKRQLIVGTIRAGGEGITLTASSTCVFISRAWSPSKNTQAEDREHRIGQKNAVEVVDIIGRNTIDLGRNQQILLKGTWLKMLLGDEVDPERVVRELNADGTPIIEIEPELEEEDE